MKFINRTVAIIKPKQPFIDLLPSINLPPENRIRKVLRLVHYIKSSYNKPILALVGYPDDLGFVEKVKERGVDYCFENPFDCDELMTVVGGCLE